MALQNNDLSLDTWKYKDVADKNKRADYLAANRDIIFQLTNLGSDLAELEYKDVEIKRNMAVAKIEEIIINLTKLKKHL